MEQTTIDRDAMEELKRLEGLATKGPWKACDDGMCTCRQVWSIPGDIPIITAKGQCVAVAHDEWGDGPEMVYGEVGAEEQAANAQLIPAMRNAFPALTAELESYRNAITWNVDCVGCAKHLDKAIQDYERIKELQTEVENLKTGIKAYSDELMRCFVHIAPTSAQDGPETMGRVIREKFDFRTHQYEVTEDHLNRQIGKTLECQCNANELAALRAAADELLRLQEDPEKWSMEHDPEMKYVLREDAAWDALRKARGG